MQLPIFKDTNQNLMLMQNKWKSLLDPILGAALSGSILLPSVSLILGNTVINHKLQAKLQGWIIVRQRSAAMIYDLQDTNQTPDLTLILHSSAKVVVDLLVF